MGGGKEGVSLACQPPLLPKTCVTPAALVNSGHSFPENVRRLTVSPPVPHASATSHVASSIPGVKLPSVTSSQNMVSVAEHQSLKLQLGDCKWSTTHDVRTLPTSSAMSPISSPLNYWQRPYIGMSQLVSLASVSQSVSCTVGSHQSVFTTVPHSVSSGSAVCSLPSLTNEESMMSLSVICPVSASGHTNSPAGITQLTYSVVGQPSPFVLSTLPIKSPASSQPLYSLGNTRLTPATTFQPIPHATITETKVSATSQTSLLSTQFLPPLLINQCSTRSNTELFTPVVFKTIKSCIRPFKLTCMVRTCFEEAALRYVSALRTAALFPSTLACTTFASFTVTTAVTASTSAIVSAASQNKGRPWEQCDSILQGIQEIRCQFAPIISTSSLHLPLLQQPLSSSVPAPSLIHSLAPVSTLRRHVSRTLRVPPRVPMVFRQTRQVRPLFRSVQGRSHDWNKTYQEGKELEAWIDVEEVSPQSTYHLYNMTADGTSNTLPITITPIDPSLKQSEGMDASSFCQFTSVGNHEQCHHPLSVCNTSHCYSVANSPLHEAQHNDLRLKSLPSFSPPQCKHYVHQTKYSVLQFVSQPSVVHSQFTAMPGTSHLHKAHDSASLGTSMLKTPVTSQQLKLTVHKGICGQDDVMVQKKVMPISEQDTGDDDVQVISVSKSDEMPNFIILSSDSSPEITEKGNKLQTYSGKKQSCKDSSSPKRSYIFALPLKTTDNLSKLIPSQDESTRGTSETLIVSEKDNNLLDLSCSSSSLFPRNEFYEYQTLRDRHLKVPEPDITQDGVKGGKNAIDDIELSDTVSDVEKSELDMMITENLKDSEVVLKAVDDLLDLNHSPPPKCPHNELCGLQQMSDQKLQSHEPKVTHNGVNENENLTDDIDLSGASTIIFDKNSELDLTLKNNARGCIIVTNTDLNKTPNISKAFSVPNITITREERLSAAVPHSFGSEKEDLNFKLLHTSSDEALSPPSPKIDHLAHKKQTHGKRLVDEGHKLQIVVSDSIKLNSIPGLSECSQNDRVKESISEMKDQDHRNQNNEVTENELIHDIKTPVSVQVKLKEHMKQEDRRICVLGCKELVNIKEKSSQPVNLKGGKSYSSDVVEKPKTESTSEENELSITLEESRSKDKVAPTVLEEGNPANDSDVYYCEFVDVSSTVFVSDGKLIFPIHMLDSHQQGYVQVTPADEIGSIHRYLSIKYDKDCQANVSRKRDLVVQSVSTLCDKSETSVKEKLGMIENGETLTRKRKKMIDEIGALMEVDEDMTEKDENSKDKSVNSLEKDEISNDKCENYEENGEVIRMNRIMTDNNAALNEKHDILVEKDNIQSEKIATLVQKRGILNEQGVTLVMFADIQENIYDSHSEQSSTTQMMTVEEDRCVQQQYETLLIDNLKKVESPKKISESQSLKKNIVENEMLCCFTSPSVRGNSFTTNQERDFQVPRKHLGNIHAEPLKQQRYINIIEDFMEECRIMGERGMKFKLQERRKVTKETSANKKERSKKIISDEWREMEECTIKLRQNTNYEDDDLKPSIIQLRKREKESELDANLQSTSVSTEQIAMIDKSVPIINGSEILDLKNCLDSEKENKELHINVELTKENKTGYKLNFIEDQKVYPGKTVIHDREVTGRVEDKSSRGDRDQCDRSSIEEVRIPELHRSLVNSGCERVYRVKHLGVNTLSHMMNQTKEMNNMLYKVNPQKNDKINRNKEAVISIDNTNQVTNGKNSTFEMNHLIKMEDDVSVIKYQELDKAESNYWGDGIITENETSGDHQLEDFDKESEVTENVNEAVRMNNIPKLIVHKEIRRNNKVDVLSRLQAPTLKPEFSIKVVSNHMAVKHDSTSSSCQSLAGVSICDFVKRISEKIDQLKIKPKSKLETEHIQCSKKHYRFFESTLEDFITKHRWVEEEKGIGYRTSQSPASHHHGSVNMCVEDTRGPLDTSNNAFCTAQVSEDLKSSTIPQMLHPLTRGVPLSSSGTQLSLSNVCSSASDTQQVGVQASTSAIQVSVSDTNASTIGSQKFNSCAKVSVNSAQPSSSSSQVPLSGIQASTNDAWILPIDMKASTESAQQSVSGTRALVIGTKISGAQISSTIDAQNFSCAKQYTSNVLSYNSGAQPSFSGEQPYTNGAQSATSGEKPFTSSVQPCSSCAQPSTSGEKPSMSDAEPCASGAQPTATEQPSTSHAMPYTSCVQPSTSCIQSSTSAEKAYNSGEQLNKNAQPSTTGAQPYISSAHPSTSGEQPSTNGEQPPSTRGAQPCTSNAKSCTSDAQLYTSVAEQLTSDSQPSSRGAQPFTSGTQHHTCYLKPSTSGVQLSTIDSEPPAVSAESNVSVKQPSAIDAQSTSGTQLATSCTLSYSIGTQLYMNIVQPHASSSLPSLKEECIKQGKRQEDEKVEEESEAEGGGSISNMAWTRKRRRDRGTTHCTLEVPLNGVYQQCVQVLVTAGENLLASLRAQAVMGHNYKFSTLQSDHTRSLLNQIIRMRKGPHKPGSEKDMQYRKLLTVHGLVKATDLLYHYGLLPALRSLQQFHTTHQVLIPGKCLSTKAHFQSVPPPVVIMSR